MPRHRLAFGWYGGKYRRLTWLLPLLPTDATHYCEPFGGSASVLINREPAPVETYNDRDGELVNFFRVLREDSEALTRAIALTPFSRAEYNQAIAAPPDSDLERARLFFVRARQVRLALAQRATPGRWGYCRLASRRGMPLMISRWHSSVAGLPEIAERLLQVQLECAPALEVIQRYDSAETLIYCDPPYPHDCRVDNHSYAHEMSDDDHRELAAVLHQVQGRVAISGYESPLMRALYADWHCHPAPVKATGASRQPRLEFLWTNYEVNIC